MKRLGYAGIWLGFGLYAWLLAPPNDPTTGALIQRLATGDWGDINPAIVALFNLMGLWPLVYAGVALVDGHQQRLPAWPFVLGSFGLGVWSLLPYLALRQPYSSLGDNFEAPSPLLRLLEARWLGWLLACTVGGMMGYGLMAGDWGNFVEQWQNSRFIHIMGLDFCLLWILFPVLLRDDLARRQGSSRLGAIALIPLIGAALYLACRPPLPQPPRASSLALGQPQVD